MHRWNMLALGATAALALLAGCEKRAAESAPDKRRLSLAIVTAESEVPRGECAFLNSTRKIHCASAPLKLLLDAVNSDRGRPFIQFLFLGKCPVVITGTWDNDIGAVMRELEEVPQVEIMKETAEGPWITCLTKREAA